MFRERKIEILFKHLSSTRFNVCSDSDDKKRLEREQSKLHELNTSEYELQSFRSRLLGPHVLAVCGGSKIYRILINPYTTVLVFLKICASVIAAFSFSLWSLEKAILGMCPVAESVRREEAQGRG